MLEKNPQHISGFNIQVIPIHKQINIIINMKTPSNLAQLYSNLLDCSKDGSHIAHCQNDSETQRVCH